MEKNLDTNKILSNKRKLISIISLILIIAVISVSTFAWYYNNRLATIKNNGTIVVKSTGSVQISFTDTDNWSSVSNAKLTSDNFDDITGDGVNMYFPTLSSTGDVVPTDIDMWEEAKVDNGKGAGGSNSLGHYMSLDLTIRSDSVMDMYLINTTKVYPNSSLNKSTYGNFSRDYIAGASRVSFCQYRLATDGTKIMPVLPTLTYVPNQKYESYRAGNSGWGFSLTGNVESNYYYYALNSSGTAFDKHTVPRLSKRIACQFVNLINNQIVPVIYVAGDTILPGTGTTKNEGYGSYPTIFVANPSDPNGGTYQSAVLLEDTYVAADYYGTNYAYIVNDANNTRYIQKVNSDSSITYVEAVKYNSDNTEKWIEKTNGNVLTYEEIQPLLFTDDATYFVSNWMDDSDFTITQDTYTISKYKCCTTDDLDSATGFYVARIIVNIWVEGTDREANISLNSGAFNFELNMLGVPHQS